MRLRCFAFAFSFGPLWNFCEIKIIKKFCDHHFRYVISNFSTKKSHYQTKPGQLETFLKISFPLLQENKRNSHIIKYFQSGEKSRVEEKMILFSYLNIVKAREKKTVRHLGMFECFGIDQIFWIISERIFLSIFIFL